MPVPGSAVSIGPLKSNSDNFATLTLSALEAWEFSGTALAVLGYPIKHSLSPLMHNAALAELAHGDQRYESWRYFRFEVSPEKLPAALTTLHERGFHGLNLTVPHKVLALTEVAEVDPGALPVGAVNTLRRTAHGWIGFNTDGYGLATAVKESFDRDLAGTDILLLGAGGAARGAAVECLQRGCASLWIANRTAENREKLINALRSVAGNIPLRGFAPGEPPAELPPGLLVVNATSAGLRADDAPPIDLARLPRPAAVYDMIYNPPLTPLLQAAQQLGLPHANGLAMLVHQGAKSLEIWSGAPAMRTAPPMAAALAENSAPTRHV